MPAREPIAGAKTAWPVSATATSLFASALHYGMAKILSSRSVSSVSQATLREMGSVSLLTRQAEIDLAKRMERANLRIQKVLSRSPLVRKMAITMYEDIRAGKVHLEELVDLGERAGGFVEGKQIKGQLCALITRK
jgi:Sigma-70 factor, region 1.2